MPKKHEYLASLESTTSRTVAIRYLSGLLEIADQANKGGNLAAACREISQDYPLDVALAAGSIRWVAKKLLREGDHRLANLLASRDEARCGRREEG